MEGLFSDYPLFAAWILLFVVGLLRGQGTYWLGRGASGAAVKVGADSAGIWGRVKAWLNGESTRAGRTVVQRVGIVAVPLCYLTVGLQTAVLVAAGLVRIPWMKFTFAQLPGVAAWATIYSTVGLAGWTAAVAAFTGSGWGWALIAIVLAVGMVLLARTAGRRTLLRAKDSGAEPTAANTQPRVSGPVRSAR